MPVPDFLRPGCTIRSSAASFSTSRISDGGSWSKRDHQVPAGTVLRTRLRPAGRRRSASVAIMLNPGSDGLIRKLRGLEAVTEVASSLWQETQEHHVRWSADRAEPRRGRQPSRRVLSQLSLREACHEGQRFRLHRTSFCGCQAPSTTATSYGAQMIHTGVRGGIRTHVRGTHA